jgi:hypothetical protein
MTVKDLSLVVLPTPQVVTAAIDGIPPITLKLSPPTQEEQERGFSAANSSVVAHALFSIDESDIKPLEALRNVVARGKKILVGGSEGWPVEPDLVRFETIVSSDVCARLDLHFRYLGLAIRRWVDVLMWSQNLDLGHSPLSIRSHSWSFDANDWHDFPLHNIRCYRAGGTINADLSSAALKTVSTLLADENQAPVHFIVMIEARSLATRNPRAGLVLAMSALEVAAKLCIARRVPMARWLVLNLPTPPIEKIIVEYVPQLCGDRGIKVPERLQKSLKKSTTIRNGIAHKGDNPPEIDKVHELLKDIEDVMWILEYAAGFDWALRHTSTTTKAELGIV